MAVITYEVLKAAINPKLLYDQLLAVLGGLFHGFQFAPGTGTLLISVEDTATPQLLQQARDVVRDHRASDLTSERQRIDALKKATFWRLSASEWKSALAAMAAAQRDEAIADAVLLIREAVKLLWREIGEGGA